ncbi:MAG: Fur family transcriptional regulator [Elusimicrobia bacterium]|nr:Fur family transcriptional regulator [Elusimicrobiota bacterium]
MHPVIGRLREHGIRPTPQRVVVARRVLDSKAHPSAEDVLNAVRRDSPLISRASVYNALKLFVRKGLLEKRPLRDGRHVYDPIVEPHHHLIDERSGRIYDIPRGLCRVRLTKPLPGFEVRGIQVVLKGRKTT